MGHSRLNSAVASECLAGYWFSMTRIARQESILGCLMGMACGDAVGLPREGMAAGRAAKMFPDLNHHYFAGRYGATSDDFDHLCMTAEALLASGGDARVYARELAGRIRIWFACLPGGIGLATVKASLRLWLGYSPEHSGVYSAGNGPAMRSPIIGVVHEGKDTLAEFVRASTQMTHTDPKAYAGALAVAVASGCSSRAPAITAVGFLQELNETLRTTGADQGLPAEVDRVADSLARKETTGEFAARLCGRRGISGYMYHTVPCVLHAWLSFPDDLEKGIKTMVACGGDTDTTAAILGGIVGARVGLEGIPDMWLNKLVLWPRNLVQLKALAHQLALGGGTAPEHHRIAGWKLLLRNIPFDALVLLHGLRRLLPPYGS